jgi:hypothetical protein
MAQLKIDPRDLADCGGQVVLACELQSRSLREQLMHRGDRRRFDEAHHDETNSYD